MDRIHGVWCSGSRTGNGNPFMLFSLELRPPVTGATGRRNSWWLCHSTLPPWGARFSRMAAVMALVMVELFMVLAGSSSVQFGGSAHLPADPLFRLRCPLAIRSLLRSGQAGCGGVRAGQRMEQDPHPRAVSRIIIRTNPSAKEMVPALEWPPSDISGMSSSTTT